MSRRRATPWAPLAPVATRALAPGRRRGLPLLACLLAVSASAAGQQLDRLGTTFASSIGQAGNMFDLVAEREIDLVALDVNLDAGTPTVEVWVRPGGYAGFEGRPGAWTLVASGAVASLGTDLPTPLPFTLGVHVSAGERLGVYVTATSGPAINYTIGDGQDDAAANADLAITQGLGLAYPFSTSYSPRIWNGAVYYHAQTGVPFCFGDGGGAVCPCGNQGEAGRGCENSRGEGARLSGEGTTSLAEDSLAFDATGVPAGKTALLFAGTQESNAGLGGLFGDGLLCAAGTFATIGVDVSNTGGVARWGPGLLADTGWSPGSARYFQVLYRDASDASPCGGRFNGTNGVRVELEP